MAKRRRRSRNSHKNWWARSTGGVSHWVLVSLAAAVAAGAGLVVANMPQTPSAATSVPQAVPTFSSGMQPITDVAVIGDSFSAGSTEDSGAAARWPALVSEQLEVQFNVLAVGGNGYAVEDAASFAKQAASVSTRADVVVMMGSINDREGYEATVAGAREAVAKIRSRAPEATVVMIGPTPPELASGARIPAEVLAARDAVRDVAAENGIPFTDPIDAGWLANGASLIGGDAIHPNDAGHAHLADKLRPIVEQALASRPTS